MPTAQASVTPGLRQGGGGGLAAGIVAPGTSTLNEGRVGDMHVLDPWWATSRMWNPFYQATHTTRPLSTPLNLTCP